MAVKVSFNLPEEALGALKDIAAERETTVTEVLRDAISKEVFFNRELAKEGSRVLLQSKDRKVRELVFPDLQRTR